MAGTKIVDATTTLTNGGPNTLLVSDFLAIGRTAGSTSLNTTIQELAAFFDLTLDEIVAGNSRVKVVDAGTGYIYIEIDAVEQLRFSADLIYPTGTGTGKVDLGKTTNAFNDLHLRGAINTGTDAIGDIYYRDASGNFVALPLGTAGEFLTVNAGGTLPEWAAYSTDYVPNYFLEGGTTYGATAIAAFTTLDGYVNSVTGTVGGTGANIYLEGFFQMSVDVDWDLTNVRFYGNGAYIVVNANNDATVGYVMTIGAGSPTFDNIVFAGSGGLISNDFASLDSRAIFIFDENGQDVIFNNCSFNDIIGGGTGSINIIDVSNVLASYSTIITFNNCVMSSHNSTTTTAAGNVPFEYNGMVINVTGTYTGGLVINVTNQLAHAFNTTYPTDATYSSLKYHCNTSPSAATGVYRLNLDDTARIGSIPALYSFVNAPSQFINTIKLSRSDILNLGGGGAPHILIDAPPIGYCIEVISVMYSLTWGASFTLVTDDLLIYYTGHTADEIVIIPNGDIIAGASMIKSYNNKYEYVTIHSNASIEIDTGTIGNNIEAGIGSSFTLTITYNLRSIT